MRNETERSVPPCDPTPDDGGNTAVVAHALGETHERGLAYLRRRLGNPEEAREVMQKFVLRALSRAEDLRETASVHGWLNRLLATSIADHQRSAIRRRHRETTMSPEYFDTSAAAEAEIEAAVCACLHPLISTLKPDQADLIRRIDLNEEPPAAVAADLGLSRGHLAVRLHRARQALKQRLVEICRTCPEHGFLNCDCDTAQVLALRPEASRKPL